MAEQVGVDHPIAIDHQAVDGVGLAGLHGGVAQAGDAFFQPIQVHPGDVAFELRLDGGTEQLALGDGQNGIAPEVIGRAVGIQQLASDFVCIALTDPHPCDRARDLFGGQCAQVDTLRAPEGGRAGKFLIEKAHPVGVAVAKQLGVGHRFGARGKN